TLRARLKRARPGPLHVVAGPRLGRGEQFAQQRRVHRDTGQHGRVALGVGVVIAQSAVLFTVLKVAGALVLVWLGVQSIRHRNEFGEGELDPVTPRTRTIVRESVVVGLTNPKTIVFFVAALPQAVVPDAGDPALQMIGLGAIFLAMGVVSDSLYGIAAGTAREWFASNRRRIAALRAVGGSALILLGIGMAFAAQG
ncbi:MAG: LysE family translocator, partial [Actinomycetes bacterium]